MTVQVTKPALNLREELSALKQPTGVAGAAMLAADTVAEQQALLGVGRRNLIINGDFQVSQRGDYSSATAITNQAYHLDRWKMGLSISTATIQRQEVVLPNNVKTYSAKVVATNNTLGNGYIAFRQIIEDFRLLSKQTVTVSAWVRTNINGFTFRHDSTTNIGEVFPATGAWEYVTATYTMPEITAAGAGANQTTLAIINYEPANAGSNTGQYFEIAQVQLELGKVATPFEHRSYGEELALCQRYFYKRKATGAGDRLAQGSATSTTAWSGFIELPVDMRVEPALITTGTASDYSLTTATGGVVTCTAVPTFDGGGWGGLLFGTASSGLTAGGGGQLRAATSNAYLAFDAEL